MADALLLLHLTSTWYLVGLCWLVQRVQYPLMSRVGADAFVDYERGHVERITPVVAPVMLVELGSALALVAIDPVLRTSFAFLASTVLLVVVWISTFAVQVPLHTRLSERFEMDAHLALVRTNWIRTLAWSLRGVLVAWLVLARI